MARRASLDSRPGCTDLKSITGRTSITPRNSLGVAGFPWARTRQEKARGPARQRRLDGRSAVQQRRHAVELQAAGVEAEKTVLETRDEAAQAHVGGHVLNQRRAFLQSVEAAAQDSKGRNNKPLRAKKASRRYWSLQGNASCPWTGAGSVRRWPPVSSGVGASTTAMRSGSDGSCFRRLFHAGARAVRRTAGR